MTNPVLLDRVHQELYPQYVNFMNNANTAEMDVCVGTGVLSPKNMYSKNNLLRCTRAIKQHLY